MGEIGDVLLGKVVGRASVGGVTIHKSPGVAARDLVAAHAVDWNSLKERPHAD